MINSHHFLNFLKKLKTETENVPLVEAAEQAFKTIFETDTTAVTPEYNPKIRITFEVTTQESAEHGDFAETGWINEEGISMLPDEFDTNELKEDAAGNETLFAQLFKNKIVEDTVDFLKKNGAVHASSSHKSNNVWYSDEGDIDYQDGSTTVKSYHLSGFTPEQEDAIFDKIKMS